MSTWLGAAVLTLLGTNLCLRGRVLARAGGLPVFVLAVAVLAHEVPQEVGDFVILLESGVPAPRALAYNVLSALTIVPGVFLGALLVERVAPAMGIMLAAAAPSWRLPCLPAI